MKTAAQLMLIALFAGCATAPAIVTPEKVEVPVAVPCQVAAPVKPEWPTDTLPASASRAEWLRAALAELKLRAAYIMELEAAFQGCK